MSDFERRFAPIVAIFGQAEGWVKGGVSRRSEPLTQSFACPIYSLRGKVVYHGSELGLPHLGILRIPVTGGDAEHLTDLKVFTLRDTTQYGLGWTPPTHRCCFAI